MNITSKSRYALQAMMDLVMNHDDSSRGVPIVDISKRQNIEVPFLEKILVELRNADLVLSKKGPKGGYSLARPATDISAAEVLEAVSENQRLTRCAHQKTKGGCLHNSAKCTAHTFWKGLERQVNSYLNDHSIHDICYGKAEALKAC